MAALRPVSYQILEIQQISAGKPEPTWLQRILRYWQPEDLYRYTLKFSCEKVNKHFGPFPLACCVIFHNGESVYLTEAQFKDGKVVYKGHTHGCLPPVEWPVTGECAMYANVHSEGMLTTEPIADEN